MAHHDDNPEKMARMHAWLATVNQELGVDPRLLADAEQSLLDMVSTVSHGPSRPGAPLTAFLIGVAAAQGGDASALADRIAQLAQKHAAEQQGDSQG